MSCQQISCNISSCIHRSPETQECTLGEPKTEYDRVISEISPHPESLVLTSLDLGKVLADKRAWSFRAQGTCMYPLIRPGDVLRIDSRSIDEVEVGDIAVCRSKSKGFLFSHRIIEKGIRNGVPFILTRPDRSNHGSDGPSYNEDLLGIISSIERNGRQISTAKQRYPFIQCLYYKFILSLIEFAFDIKIWLMKFIMRFQDNPFCQYFIRVLLFCARVKTSYSIEIPFTGKWELGVYESMPLEKFNLSSFAGQGRARTKWRIGLIINGKPPKAAWVSFVCRPEGCHFAGWWVDDYNVRMRFLGAGFKEKLIRKAAEILARSGERLQVPEEKKGE